VRCSAACVVRARLDYALDPLDDVVRLSRAGRGKLTLTGAAIVTPLRRGPVRVHLSYGAPGARQALERTVTLQLSRTFALPRTTAVRARRAGDMIRVTWSVRHAEPGLAYFVTGAATREAGGEPLVTKGIAKRTPGRRFSLTLRAGRDVRYVTVRPEIPVGPAAQSVIVRVR
jgi:hypothetical protein